MKTKTHEQKMDELISEFQSKLPKGNRVFIAVFADAGDSNVLTTTSNLCEHEIEKFVHFALCKELEHRTKRN